MIATRRSADDWKRIIREQQFSGLTVAVFCRRARLPQASFYLWRKKLRGRQRRPSAPHPSDPAFVEVKLHDEPGDRGEQAATSSGIELRLPGRRRVVVRPGFDRRTLLDLLSALEHGA